MQKRIFILIIIAFLLFLISGCEEIELQDMKIKKYENYNTMLEKCGKEGTVFISTDGITKNNVSYVFNDILKERVKQDKEIDVISFDLNSTLYGDYIYITASYQLSLQEKKYCFCKFNHKTIEIDDMRYFDYDVRATKYGNYILFTNLGDWIFYNEDGESIDSFLNGNDYIIASGCYFPRVKGEEIIFYDYDFNMYKIKNYKIDRVSYFKNNHLYCHESTQEFVIDVTTQKKYDGDEYLEIKNNDYNNEYTAEVKKYNINYNNYYECELLDIDVVVSIDDLKQINDYISFTEELFDTHLLIEQVLYLDEARYITVGSKEKFFGIDIGYATYKLVYEVFDDGTINYVGCASTVFGALVNIYYN